MDTILVRRKRKSSGRQKRIAVATRPALRGRARRAFQVLGPMAFLVFFPAPTWAGIVPSDFLFGTLNGALLRSGSGFTSAVQI